MQRFVTTDFTSCCQDGFVYKQLHAQLIMTQIQLNLSELLIFTSRIVILLQKKKEKKRLWYDLLARLTTHYLQGLVKAMGWAAQPFR